MLMMRRVFYLVYVCAHVCLCIPFLLNLDMFFPCYKELKELGSDSGDGENININN